MPPPSLARRAAMVAAILALAACGAVFKTDYDAPVDRAVSAQWRVASVEVDVPHTLTVSEARTLLPRADIVWREDPVGDRYAQVDQIMTDVARGVQYSSCNSTHGDSRLWVQKYCIQYPEFVKRNDGCNQMLPSALH